MASSLLACFFLALAVCHAQYMGGVKTPGRTYDISDFGGVGDGKTLNTKAFEAAVQCSPN